MSNPSENKTWLEATKQAMKKSLLCGLECGILPSATRSGAVEDVYVGFMSLKSSSLALDLRELS